MLTWLLLLIGFPLASFDSLFAFVVSDSLVGVGASGGAAAPAANGAAAGGDAPAAIGALPSVGQSPTFEKSLAYKYRNAPISK